MYTQTQVLDQPSFYVSNQENTRVKVGILKLVDQDYEVFRGENYIGRSDICDIIINNPNISGKHAVIEVEDEESHVIYDCGSTNKTKLGQIKLKPNIRYNLKDGDLITFADCITTYIKVENIAQDKDDTDSDTGSESLFCDALVPETPLRMRLKNHEVSEIVVAETPEPEDMTNVLETAKNENGADEDIFDVSISNMNRNVTEKGGFIIGNNSVSEAETQLNEMLYCKPKVSRLGSKLFEDDDSFDDDCIPATQGSFNDPTKNHEDDKHSLNDDILNKILPERQVENSNTFLNSKFRKVVQVLEKKELQNRICDAETHLESLQKESDIILFSQDSIYGKETQIPGLENEEENGEKSFIQDKVTHPVGNMILELKESNDDTFDMETQAPEFDKELSVDNVKKQVNDSTNIFTTTSRIMRSSNVRSAIKEKRNKNMKNKESLKQDFSEAISDDISNDLTQINTRLSTSVENGIEEHIAINCDELTQVNINIGDLKSKANKKKKSNGVLVNKSLNSTINKKNVSKNEPISEEVDISDDCTQINICINLNKNTDEVQLRIDEKKSDMHVGGSNSEKSLKLNEELTQANLNLKSVYDVPCVSSRLEDMYTSEALTQINYNLLGKNLFDEKKMIQNFNEDEDPIFDAVTQVSTSHNFIDDSSIDKDEELRETKSLHVVKQIVVKPNESGKKLPYIKTINNRLEDMNISEALTQTNYNLLENNIIEENKIVQDFYEDKDPIFDAVTQVSTSHNFIDDSSIDNDEELGETKSLHVVKQIVVKPNESGKKLPYIKTINNRLEDMNISEALTQTNYNLLENNIIEENKIVQDFYEDKDPIFDAVTQVQNPQILLDGDNTVNNEKLPQTESLPTKDVKSTILHRKVLDLNDESNESESLLAIVSEDVDEMFGEENNKFDDTEDPRNKIKHVSKCDSHKPLKGDNNSNEISKLETSVLGMNISNTDDTNFDFSESLLQRAVAASEATLSPGLKPVYSDDEDDEVINLPQGGRRTNRTRRYTKKMLDFLNSPMDKAIVENINLKRQSSIVSENIRRKTMKINQDPVVELTKISTQEIDSYVIKNNLEDENVFQENNIKDKQKSKLKKFLDKDISEDSSHEGIQEKKLNTSLIIVGSNSEKQETVTTDVKCKEDFINQKSSLLTNMFDVKSKNHKQGSKINTFTKTGKVSGIDLNVSIPCALKSKRSNVLKKHSVDEEKKSKKIVNKESAKQNSKKQSLVNNNKEHSCTNNAEKSVNHNTTKNLDSRRCITKNTNTISIGEKLFARSTRRTVVENNLILKEIIDKQVNKSKRKINKTNIQEKQHTKETGGNSSSEVTGAQNVNILKVVEDSVNLKIIPSKKTCGTVTATKCNIPEVLDNQILNLSQNNFKQYKELKQSGSENNPIAFKLSVVEKVNICTRSLRNKNIPKTSSNLKSCTLKGDHPEESHGNKTICASRSIKTIVPTGAKVVERLKVKEIKQHLNGHSIEDLDQTHQRINTKSSKYSVDKPNHSTRSTKASNEDIAEKLNARVRNDTKAIDLIKGDVKKSTLKGTKVKADEETFSKKSKENKAKVNEEPFSEKSNHLNRSAKASGEDLCDKLNLCVRNPTKTIDLVKEDTKESTCKVAKTKVYEEPLRKKTYHSTRSTRNKVLSKIEIAKKDKSDTKYLPELEKEDEMVKPKTSIKAVEVIPVNTANHLAGNKNKQNSRKTKAVDDLNEVLPVKKSKRIATRNKLTMPIIEDFNTRNPDDISSTFPDETQQKITSVSCKKDVKIEDFKRNKRGKPQKHLKNKRAKYETSEQFIQSNSSLIYDENHVGHCSISNYKSNFRTSKSSAMECSTSFESQDENLTGTEMKKVENNSINQGTRKEKGKFIDDSEIISHISSTQLNSLSKHEDCVISDNEDTTNRSSASRFPSPATRMMGRRGEKVLFTGMSDPKLKAVVKKLGGTIVESPQTCSVLVTEKIRRTVKLLCCIGRGIPIVSPKWIEESKYVGRLQDPWKHLIIDKETENKYSFRLEKSLNLAKRALFLKNYSVYATPSVKPPPSDLKGIVESCGGEFLDEESELCPGSNCIIISCNEDKSLWKKMKNKNTTPLIVNSEALLSGVLQQRLDVETYRLNM